MSYLPVVPEVDVVVVAYNSREVLRGCVEPLAHEPDLHVIVVDNASADGSLDVVSDLSIERLALNTNGGFAAGCNVGWRAGTSPHVLFLNPDARLEPAGLRRLVTELDEHPGAAVAAPKIVDADGTLDFSVRRFPRLRSTYAQALFAHRFFPTAGWVDEVIRDPRVYETAAAVEWVSGACVLVRRRILERIGGWDAGFFFYCEDIDLCRRVHDAGGEIRFVPEAVATHIGGASSPRAAMLPMLAKSRVRYARKHRGTAGRLAERLGIALGEATHVVVSKGGRDSRAGHARALVRALSPKA
jgi:N-acetylglucosaminyl-diphospho-decaprenol L-rhamnosyltransferase